MRKWEKMERQRGHQLLPGFCNEGGVEAWSGCWGYAELGEGGFMIGESPVKEERRTLQRNTRCSLEQLFLEASGLSDESVQPRGDWRAQMPDVRVGVMGGWRKRRKFKVIF